MYDCFSYWKQTGKGGKTDTIFSTSEDFRLRPVIGHAIIFTSEKIRLANQMASSFQQIIFNC